MRSLLYFAFLWVALLRTVLAPYPSALLDEVVELSSPRSPERAPGAGVGNHARLDADGSIPDEDQLAESDSGEDDDFFVEAGMSGRGDSFRSSARPPVCCVVPPRHVLDRLDRPPRA